MGADVHVSPPAERDLDEIVTYLILESESAAAGLLERFGQVAARLADHPHIGPLSRHPIRDGLRRLAMPPYVVFYRVVPGRVEIVRVLHAARNLDDRELFPD